MSEPLASQTSEQEALSKNEFIESQRAAVESLYSFINRQNSPVSDELRAQFKLILRASSGNGALQGSGIESDDARYLANDEGTGFLQLGKIHTKGPENEGSVDFFDRYGFIGATTKFSDLMLIFEPGQKQRVINEEEAVLTEEQWQKIEQAGFTRRGVQGLRPGSDVQFVVYNPKDQLVVQSITQVLQVHPEFAEKVKTIAQFTDSLSARGLLAGEQPAHADLHMQELIDAVLALPIEKSVIHKYLTSELLPLLSSEDRVNIVVELFKDEGFISEEVFLERAESLSLQKDIVRTLTDNELEQIQVRISQGYRPDKALPLIYLKYTLNGTELPKPVLEYLYITDEVRMLKKFAQASPEEWKTLAAQVAALKEKTPVYEYFLRITADRSDEDRKAITLSRIDHLLMNKGIGVQVLRREIIADSEIPKWKKILPKLAQFLTGTGMPPFSREKKATEDFLNTDREYGTLRYDVAYDLSHLEHNLGETWVHDQGRRSRLYEITPNAEKIVFVQKLIPQVVPELAVRLRLLLTEYQQPKNS